MSRRIQSAGRALLFIPVYCGGIAFVTLATACPVTTGTAPIMTQGPVQASWSAEPLVPVVGESFVIRITLCPSSAKLVKVTADMPDHRHGMNYKPSFTQTAEGLWRVEGMLWHMPGKWELKIDAALEGVNFRLSQSVILQ